MKKILKAIIALILIITVKSINASEIEINYSEWSTQYPSGLSDAFIQSEDRYKWYKFNDDNEVLYVDEYSTTKDGYIKDEGSRTTFYRYITNTTLVFNSKNEIVTNTSYCKKNFCYIVTSTTPTMVDPSDKIESDYETTTMPELNPTVAPYTGDFIGYSIVAFVICLTTLTVILIKRRKNNASKKSIFVE